MHDLILLSLAMLASGCVAGIFAGLLGVGGGIVIVPVMEIALSMLQVDVSVRMHIAVATSLAVIIPTSLSSSFAHHRRAAVDLALVKRWAPFVLIGALAGTYAAAQVHSKVLAAVFAVFAFLIGMKMVFWLEETALRDDVPSGWSVNAIPSAIGFFSSMMGIGGGTFSVMVLTLFGKPIHRAVGTAALLGLFIALPGAIGFVIAGWGNALLPVGSFGFVNVVGFLLIAPMTVLTAPLGAWLAHRLSRGQLNLAFGLFLLLAAARMTSRAL